VVLHSQGLRNKCRSVSGMVTMGTYYYYYYYYLRSAKQQTLGDKSPQSNFVRVYSDGTCYWWPLFEQSESHCSIDVTWYPFDDQTCNLSFESWKYNSRMLNITAKQLPELDYHYNPNEEWALQGRSRRLRFTSISK